MNYGRAARPRLSPRSDNYSGANFDMPMPRRSRVTLSSERRRAHTCRATVAGVDYEVSMRPAATMNLSDRRPERITRTP